MSVAQIASLAGVSTATVSRVLSDSPLVREKTAAQVRKVIEEVGYQPPERRSSRRRRRTRSDASGALANLEGRSVALVTLGQSYQEWFRVRSIGLFAAGLTAEVRGANGSLLLDEMPDPMTLCPAIARGEVDAAILLVKSELADTPQGLEALGRISRKLPVVWAMGAHAGVAPVDRVVPDNLGIGGMAAQYLIDQGLRRLTFVTENPTWSLTQLRAFGFSHACDAAGLETSTYIATEKEASARMYPGRVHVCETLRDVVQKIKRANQKPDAVFLPRDIETAHFYRYLREAGLEPQADFTVVSCDNNDTQLSIMDPRPVTIDIRVDEIARRTLRCLRARMLHRDVPPILMSVAPRLVQPDG